MSEPLTAALARAASRFVGESKVGKRKGSVAAVARAMTERGTQISNNTLSRKLDGAYPLDTNEIAALAAVLGVTPDAIWEDALRIMRDPDGGDPLEAPRSEAGRKALEEGRAAGMPAKRTARTRRSTG